jgi:hypothetical protein
VAQALFGAVRETEDPHADHLEIDAQLDEEARSLRPRYLDDCWTWRR